MLTGLWLTAFLMGLAGAPHCAAMCGAACSLAFPKGVPPAALLGRALGYAVLGGVAAVAAGWISAWGREIAMLKPLWVMAQVAVLLLGLVLLWTGHVPARIDQWGKQGYAAVRARVQSALPALAGRAPWLLALLGGTLWAALPCGLLYAALMVAALAQGPLEGASVMLAFAVPSSLGVWGAPRLLAWLRMRGQAAQTVQATPLAQGADATVVPVIWLQRRVTASSDALSTPDAAVQRDAGAVTPASNALVQGRGAWVDPRWAVRASGLCLALMAGWSVWHQLVAQWQAWCA